ncbi:hypothetical protein BHU72_11155 [Desulfuribacillus stibiiarsenatis]|uniref:Protein kinase domain-containing protein n=1 Tax=Desulfuribacillus stibiiarsenatis TaxID=1390249 RepID=A0A1E5L2L5_9FIRM|nr:protein kinase [Desulfuribacillus stibiiarsenatis]OEH84354.1 hypothetical protein BHU72_11155 [Desulfuribacillus stibiiarsenatis]
MLCKVDELQLRFGEVVTGCWSKSSYRVIRELGRGAIGVVYLVENLNNNQVCAMKIAPSMQNIVAEYNRLRKIQKEVQSQHFGPLLYELDDIVEAQVKYYYYTMEYIEGSSLVDKHRNMTFDTKVQSLQEILTYLHTLHQKQYIFADLKPENILIENKTEKIRFIDFGGVVSVGKMVKQYSDLYDRGSWRMGSRKADLQYDIFAFGIIMMQMFTKPDHLTNAIKNTLPIYALYDIIHKELAPSLKVIGIKLFSEKYNSADDVRKDIQSYVIDKKVIQNPTSSTLRQAKAVNASQSIKVTTFSIKRGFQWNWIDGAFWASFVFMVGSLMLFFI